ncbi:hypothetical protein ACHAXS_002323 [Conticribra weissflogii]
MKSKEAGTISHHRRRSHSSNKSEDTVPQEGKLALTPQVLQRALLTKEATTTALGQRVSDQPMRPKVELELGLD